MSVISATKNSGVAKNSKDTFSISMRVFDLIVIYVANNLQVKQMFEGIKIKLIQLIL